MPCQLHDRSAGPRPRLHVRGHAHCRLFQIRLRLTKRLLDFHTKLTITPANHNDYASMISNTAADYEADPHTPGFAHPTWYAALHARVLRLPPALFFATALLLQKIGSLRPSATRTDQHARALAW